LILPRANDRRICHTSHVWETPVLLPFMCTHHVLLQFRHDINLGLTFRHLGIAEFAPTVHVTSSALQYKISWHWSGAAHFNFRCLAYTHLRRPHLSLLWRPDHILNLKHLSRMNSKAILRNCEYVEKASRQSSCQKQSKFNGTQKLSANFSCRRTILEIEVEFECQIQFSKMCSRFLEEF
jgi:hypothetical protein